MAQIVTIQLARLEKLLADKRIALEMGQDAIKWLAERGYSPAYGARPLKRVIQNELQDVLAEEILSGSIHDGMKVRVSLGIDKDKGGLVVEAVNCALDGEDERVKDGKATNEERAA